MRTAHILLFAVLFFSAASSLSFAAKKRYAFVYLDDFNKFQVKESNTPVDFGIAYGSYDDKIATTGWGVLDIKTTDKYDARMNSDSMQAYAAGLLEAYFTHSHIYDFYMNYVINEYHLNGSVPLVITSWLQKQQEWIRAQICAPENKDDRFWQAMDRVVAQYDGISDGYARFAPHDKKLPSYALNIINSAGDLETLNDFYVTSSMNPRINRRLDPAIKRIADLSSRNPLPPLSAVLTDCSALIKIKPDFSDVFFGHTTWRGYYAMTRIYKYYTFHFSQLFEDDPSSAVVSVSFSSTPGFISSKDDFYITHNKLVVMETTNNVFNTTLFQKYLTPHSALSWQRVIICNLLAKGGSQWVSLFARYNSGTYNNQWMVADVKQFPKDQPDARLSQFLYIIEQIPGFTKSGDVSSVLQDQGLYWPSYNIPFFKEIYNISGYPEYFAKYGNQFSYQKCARAEILRRDHSKATTFSAMKAMMQYNDWKNDPLSLGDPVNSISARADLSTQRMRAFGGIDSKITCAGRVANGLAASIISGPTHQNGNPPFSWKQSPAFDSISHLGVPEVFNFDWVDVKME